MSLANVCTPYYDDGDEITGHCDLAVTGKRFVKINNNRQSGPAFDLAGTGAEGGNYRIAPADAGGRVFGVASHDAAVGKKVTVLRGSKTVLPVTADGALTAFAEVEVGASGKAKAKSTGVAVGVCLSAAADGADAEISLY